MPITSLVVMLADLRSAYNVGSIFRTAETAGVTQLILTGITPTPLEPKLQKTALGSIDHVNWIHHCLTKSAITVVRRSGFTVVAAEVKPQAESFFDYDFPPKTCLIMGNEVTGLSDDLIALTDNLIQIPQFGFKESLNVAVAAGILIYGWRRRYLPPHSSPK